MRSLRFQLVFWFGSCLLFAFASNNAEENKPTKISNVEAQIDLKKFLGGCKKPERGPPGPTGATGPAGSASATGATGATGPTGASLTPIFASYSLPFPPGAISINTNEPIPFTSSGQNASSPAVGGIVLDSTTNVFTIPVDGFYEISYGYSSFWSSGTIVGLGIFTGSLPVFDHIVPNSSISQGIGAQYQMTSGNIIIPLSAGDQIALINTNNGGPPPTGNVPTDFVGLVPYPALNAQDQTAAYITFIKVGDLSL